MIGFLATLLIAVALNIVAYLIMPKPKTGKPEAAKEMDDPIAEAGIEIPVVFGSLTKKSPNVLWFGDKSMFTYMISA